MLNKQDKNLILKLQGRIQETTTKNAEKTPEEQFSSLLDFTKKNILLNTDIELRLYEKYLHELANFTNATLRDLEIKNNGSVDYYFDFIEALKSDIYEDTNTTSFHTVYFLSIFTRMSNKTYHWPSVIEDYKVSDLYKHYFTHIQNIYYLTTRIPTESFDVILQDTIAIFQSEIKKKKDPKKELNTGIIHCVADIVISIYEECILQHNYEFLQDHKLLFKRNSILAKVMNELEDIITKQEQTSQIYAKFFCTYARFQACDTDLVGSSISFQKALAFEDKKRLDYSDRISYIREKRQISNLVLNQKKSYENLNKVKEDTQELSDRINSSLTKNLEFMGLFAGLIGFMIVSVNIAANVDYEYALQLVAISFLSIIVTFTTIDMVINNKSIKKSPISYIVLFVALILITGVLLLLY